jgi:hypothetical protein
MRNLTAAVAMMVLVPLAAAAQDAVPALKGTWQGTGKILLYGRRTPDMGDHIVRQQRRQGAVRVGDVVRQQDHPRRRHRRLLPHHCRIGRSYREVLCPEPDRRPAGHRGHVLHDGSGEELTARWAERTHRSLAVVALSVQNSFRDEVPRSARLTSHGPIEISQVRLKRLPKMQNQAFEPTRECETAAQTMRRRRPNISHLAISVPAL